MRTLPSHLAAHQKFNARDQFVTSTAEAGFSILEVIASVVVLSVGILAAVRMQITAISTNRAPVANQEIATIARRAIEEATADTPITGTRTIGGYQVEVTVEGCNFTGTTLNCGGAAGTGDVQSIEASVTSEIDNIEFVTRTFRAN